MDQELREKTQLDTVYGIASPNPRAFLEEIRKQVGTQVLFAKFYERIGVQEIQELKRFLYEKQEGERTYLYIATQEIGHEAQNALLKDFEEVRGKKIILIVPHLSLLLPTLRSRMTMLSLAQRGDSTSVLHEEARKFISLPLAQKMDIVQHYLRADDASAKEKFSSFLNACEHILQGERKKKKTSLRECLKVKEQMYAQGASLKNLLETLAVVLSLEEE